MTHWGQGTTFFRGRLTVVEGGHQAGIIERFVYADASLRFPHETLEHSCESIEDSPQIGNCVQCTMRADRFATHAPCVAVDDCVFVKNPNLQTAQKVADVIAVRSGKAIAVLQRRTGNRCRGGKPPRLGFQSAGCRCQSLNRCVA